MFKPGIRTLAPLSAVLLLPFLTSGNDAPSRVEQVERRGSITVLTRNGASSYFLGAEGETGPEYELARAFADFLGVDIDVHVASAFGQLAQLLEAGQGDLIAANLTRTASREAKFRFGPDYDEAHTEVVYRRGSVRPRSLQDLAGKRVAVIAGTTYEEILQAAADEIPGLNWEALPDAGMEDLLLAVAEGDIDATLVDSNILRINRQFYPRVNRAFTLDQTQPQAWAFRMDEDDSLVEQAHVFMAQARENGTLAAVQDRFYNHSNQLDQVGMFQFLKQVRERLPELRPVFVEVASQHEMDWRLLAAMGYQESHWNPQARSHTGVRGIMMLTRNTARQMGLQDRRDPLQSIEGGARYFLRMWHRIPERIPEPDRTWMALAAYNMGWGHLEDARVLTQRQGGNPDVWADVNQRLPLLTQEKWHSQTRFGYARGMEAQRYVRNIRNYFDILVWMETRAHPMLVSDYQPISLETAAP
ncbi:MAG TPA: membrane-bound lytic murein transglycosylase MltF [Xanthomonadales bacterium]|nr:membrane-bound lytic murein transglycosylase MltF [Xanthomonadales bacterium]